MKAQAGFTLVELMIVVTIAVIFMAIAAMIFTHWNDKHTVEAYTKEIHSILLKARNDAANTNTQQLVTLAANQLQVTQDDDSDGAVDAGEPTTTNPFPRFAIKFTVSPIVFNRRGITSNIQTITIPVWSVADPTGYSLNASPGVDCIVVAQTRINMGLMTGGVCAQQ
ncbi:MAG: GspH/FimT family pseudopilin [Desulfurivibrionaceae bacterium]